MKADLSYGPERLFQPFPFPPGYQLFDELLQIGERYHEHRRELMLKLQLGLTKTYNLFHDRELSVELVAKESKQPLPVAESGHADLLQLRALHVKMDQAVLSAYGWHQPSDAGPAIALRHDFYEVDYLPENDRVRYTIHPDVRKEILKRLLQFNHKIYAEEEAKGLHQKKPAKTAVAIQPGATDLPLFRILPPAAPAPVKTPSLPEVVARFNFVLPSRQRPRVNSTAEFYTTLLPALVQEAGGKLSYLNLVEAMSFLASPPATAASLPAPAAPAFNIWRSTFQSPLVAPSALQAALHDLIVMRHALNIRRDGNEFLLFKGIQWTDITFDWTLLDARVALSHAASAGAALPPWLAAISDGDLQHWATA